MIPDPAILRAPALCCPGRCVGAQAGREAAGLEHAPMAGHKVSEVAKKPGHVFGAHMPKGTDEDTNVRNITRA